MAAQNVDAQLEEGTTTLIDLKSSDTVRLILPSTMTAAAQWAKDGQLIGADEVVNVQVAAGRSVSYEVTEGDHTASATVRWRPDAPLRVGSTARQGQGTLVVTWTKLADEGKLAHYEVDLNPRPALAQLPRRVKKSGEVIFAGLPVDLYEASVTAVAAYDSTLVKSEAKTADPVEVEQTPSGYSSRAVRLLLAAAAVLFVTAVVLVFTGPLGEEVAVDLQWWAVSIGIFVVAAIGCLIAAVRRPANLLSGADGRVSTSKVNVALWTIAVAFGITTLACIALGADRFERTNPCEANASSAATTSGDTGDKGVCVKKGKDNEPDTILSADELTIDKTFKDGLAPEYLVLLGAPFAALAGAKSIVNRDLKNESIQKVESLSPARFREALTKDDGDADLVDSQYLMFTVVLLFYFLMTFLFHPYSLPALPWGLVGLTGISAGTYLANKAATENGLTVDALVPSTAAAGSQVRILGRNFLPPGSTQYPNGGVQVMLGSTSVVPQSVSNTEIKVDLPTGIATGNHDVVITTAANVAAGGGTLTVT